ETTTTATTTSADFHRIIETPPADPAWRIDDRHSHMGPIDDTPPQEPVRFRPGRLPQDSFPVRSRLAGDVATTRRSGSVASIAGADLPRMTGMASRNANRAASSWDRPRHRPVAM